MNRSLSTQFAFTTKLNVRKGPGLLGTAVDHALSLSLVFARRAHFRLQIGQWPLNLDSDRVADYGKYLLLSIRLVPL